MGFGEVAVQVFSLYGREEYEQALAHANQRLAHRPGPSVRVAEVPTGTVVAIQGAQARPEEVATIWAAATPDGWTVVTPAASEPEPSGGWAWPHSVEASAVSVKRDTEGLSLHPPLVLTGFSIGSAVACHLAISRALPVEGLILVAPSTRSGLDDVREVVGLGIPLLFIGGDEGIRADQYKRLRDDIAGVAHVTIEILAGLGHEHPPDLGRRVSDFLGALSSPNPPG